jgi:hypothetical protein
MIKTLLYSFGILVVLANFAQAQTAPCPEGYICTIADTDSTVTTNGETTTNINSPPPSAIAPALNMSNSDLCTVGVSGAVQTQILGISAAKTVRDMNCEKLKNAKTLYDMGMKVAAVSTMCQDPRIFQAMMDAGTPCPFQGMIGSDAKIAWEANPDKVPGDNNGKIFNMDPSTKSTVYGGGFVLLLLLGLAGGI